MLPSGIFICTLGFVARNWVNRYRPRGLTTVDVDSNSGPISFHPHPSITWFVIESHLRVYFAIIISRQTSRLPQSCVLWRSRTVLELSVFDLKISSLNGTDGRLKRSCPRGNMQFFGCCFRSKDNFEFALKEWLQGLVIYGRKLGAFKVDYQLNMFVLSIWMK